MACDSELATEWPGPDTCDGCTRFGRLALFLRHDALVRMPIRMSLKESINVHEYLLEEKYIAITNFWPSGGSLLYFLIVNLCECT